MERGGGEREAFLEVMGLLLAMYVLSPIPVVQYTLSSIFPFLSLSFSAPGKNIWRIFC